MGRQTPRGGCDARPAHDFGTGGLHRAGDRQPPASGWPARQRHLGHPHSQLSTFAFAPPHTNRAPSPNPPWGETRPPPPPPEPHPHPAPPFATRQRVDALLAPADGLLSDSKDLN